MRRDTLHSTFCTLHYTYLPNEALREFSMKSMSVCRFLCLVCACKYIIVYIRHAINKWSAHWRRAHTKLIIPGNVRFRHSQYNNHKTGISSEMRASACKHTNDAHTYKDNTEKVPFVCSTLMKSYPPRTSITSENELETCCNPDSVIKPVSLSPGVRGGGNCHRPSVCRAALN